MTFVQWFIFITCVFIIVQDIIFRKKSLNDISYSRYFENKEVFEGSENVMVENIKNMKFLIIPWLVVESKINVNLRFTKQFNLDIKYGQFHKSVFSLMPYMGITRRHKVKCLKRGYYNVNTVTLTSGDLIGTDRFFKSIDVDADLYVYPKIIPLDKIPFMPHNLSGDVVVKRWIIEDPFIISGVREYRSGDSLNRVDWNSTAKMNRIMVKNNDHTANPKLMIYLNFEITEDMWDTVTDVQCIENGISYCASIVQYTISHGIPTGFGCNGFIEGYPDEFIKTESRCSSEHMNFLFKLFALLIIKREGTFHTFLQHDIDNRVSGLDFLILTPYVSDRMKEQIKELKMYGNSVTVLPLGLTEGAA